jgi:hypothetical protein
MMRVFIDGVSIIGPGLEGWENSLPILSGRQAHGEGAMPSPQGGRLPPAERRRATAVTRLALEAAERAIPVGVDPKHIATVFASSGGEVETIHRIFSELATTERQISPTQFHNSVHNAASGYWSIATGSQCASTSLSCFDDSFTAGLLEAAVQAVTEGAPVLLVAYDFPPLPPLAEFRLLRAPFGTALLLSPERSAHSLMELQLAFEAAPPTELSRMSDPGLEALRAGNPAARGLPLLAALAAGARATIVLSCALTGSLRLRTQPCG